LAVLHSSAVPVAAPAKPLEHRDHLLAPYFRSHRGKLEKKTSRTKIYFLGAGLNAEVRRKVKSNGKTEVRKTFSDYHELRIERRSVRFLRSVVAKAGCKNDLGVIRILGQVGNSLILEDVNGRTLEEILEDRLLPKTARNELIRKYIRLRDEINTYILTHYRKYVCVTERKRGSSRWRDKLFIVICDDESIKHVLLRPDNIVVDSKHLSFKLIDPY
jgi:hypothetical protein